ncbi:MAG: hypothetical protein WCN85_15675, partial [Burkholderiales bacterium]
MNPPKKLLGKQVAGKPDASGSVDSGLSPVRDAEDGAFAPTPQELERLLFAVETSHQINKRFQFFLWAQGVLQSFLPHQTLIVATGNMTGTAIRSNTVNGNAGGISLVGARNLVVAANGIGSNT